ncbi:MAG: MrpF/PhaF family protein, partial [Alphaproteobacteria bacterium]|nr:MrpF/PhaF family protein [Alphaproteobacteria bacterium]
VVLIAVHGFLAGRPEFLDIALVYALINFIATIAVTKYVKFSHLGHPLGEDERGDV